LRSATSSSRRPSTAALKSTPIRSASPFKPVLTLTDKAHKIIAPNNHQTANKKSANPSLSHQPAQQRTTKNNRISKFFAASTITAIANSQKTTTHKILNQLFFS
jgi:hypothetical protein